MVTIQTTQKRVKCISFIFTIILLLTTSISVGQAHIHDASCLTASEQQYRYGMSSMNTQLLADNTFQNAFEQQFGLTFEAFQSVNGFFINQISDDLLKEFSTIGIPSLATYQDAYLSRINHYAALDELLFEIPSDHNVTKIYYGKHGFNPIERGTYSTPKTATCLNAGFEENSWNSWQTLCATATNGFTYLNPVAYTPPGGCSSPANTPQQHSLWTGGNDAIGNFPRVFQGGVSAMIGNGAQASNPVHQASVLRKTFVVDPNNTIITYSYAAVLDATGAHTAAQQPFFNVRLLVNNTSVACAQYSASAGDGQPGWINSGGRWYRNWTTIAVPLEQYVGETVTLEFSVSDCFVSGGSHWGYAYVDVSCNNMEIQQLCEGSSTVLAAPTEGITSYLWSTGATTSSITVTTPGTYTVDVTPYGSTCAVRISLEATLYPVPTAVVTASNQSICVGGDIDFTNSSTVTTGGNFASYRWNFGDGIITPNGLGNISGVNQTTGTYISPNHIYAAVGNYTATLTATTTDGCTSTATVPISVIQGPQATITGATTVCEGAANPTITLTGSQTPSPFTFTYNLNNGPSQTITTATNSVSIPVSTDIPGQYTYNLTYVLSSSSAMCEQAQTGSVTIVVNPAPTATILQDAIVCQDDTNPLVTFTGANGLGNYSFAYNLNGGASQTITSSGSNTATIQVPTATANTYTYSLTSVTDLSTGCTTSIDQATNNATIVVHPKPNATLTGSTVLCQNENAPQLTFTGTNSTSNYLFTYIINDGTTQNIQSSAGSNSTTITSPTNVPGTTTYTLTQVTDPATGCINELNDIETVLINPLPTATIYGSSIVCQQDESPNISFVGNNGTSSYLFTYTLNGGAPTTINSTTSNEISIPVSTDQSMSHFYEIVNVVDVNTGCVQNQTGSATVTINPTPNATFSGTTTVCQLDPKPIVMFEGSSATSSYLFHYTINNGPLLIATAPLNPGTTTVEQSTDIPGTYNYRLLKVTDASTLCFKDLDEQFPIVIRPLPVASISNAVEACHNDPLTMEVTLTGSIGEAPYTFSYSINNGPTNLVTSTGNSVTLPMPTTTVGQFTYQLTHIKEGGIYGCNQAQNLQTAVTIYPLPNVDAGTSFSVCTGVPIVLTGAGAVSYDWDNNVLNGQPFTPNDTTLYHVIGTDQNGCKNNDSVIVNVVPIPQMDFEGKNLYGCSPVVPTFINHSTGNLTSCTWYLGNGQTIQGCDSITTSFQYPGCFPVTLTVSTPEGCTNTMTINDYVCVEANPIASFYPNPSELSTYDWETTMVNESMGAAFYQWNFGDGTALSSQHSPYHAYPNEGGGIYRVQLIATSPAGCVDTATAIVTVKDELLFYVPNTFTPDGDNYNETFKPIFTAGYDPLGYTLYIFNRWGELIFESHDTEVGWNGRYGIDSKLCQDGTYTWTIDIKKKASSGSQQFNGHINLIR